MAGGGAALALVPHWETWRAPFASAAVVAAAGVALVLAAPREAARPPLAARLQTIVDRRLARLAAMHAARSGSPSCSGTGS